jgi:diguanylate cyclase (GGDEF)-like protein
MEAFLLLDRASPGLPVVAVGGDVEPLTGLLPEKIIGRQWPPVWDEDVHAHPLEELRTAAERGDTARVRLAAAGRDEGIDTEVTVRGLQGGSRLALCRIAEALDPEEVVHLAFHDRLTGLPNRTLLERHLSLALPRALRAQRCVVVLFIDLDGFKQVNDRLGHAAGDEVLRETARRLCGVIRADDVLARLGGDEFVLVASDVETDPRGVADAIAAQVDRVLDAPIVLTGGDRCHIGASIGLSVFPADGTDTAALLARADAMMYRTKRMSSARPVLDPPTELARLVERAASLKHELAQTRRTQLEVNEAARALLGSRPVPRFGRL